jgi:pimeloyl-ACP methyl ester carboxylesterase
MPCVIYCHGNSASRIDALASAEGLLPIGINLFCFDFSGCGKSEGDYISLGYHEKNDLKKVIEHLRKSGTVSTIGLWGRSMGAATSLLYAKTDPSIAAMVLDSPFSSLKILAEELATRYTKIPRFIVTAALQIVRRTIKNKANFDVFDVNPIDHAPESFIPALFIVGKDDDFILPKHSEAIYEKYSGDKSFLVCSGDHNSERP